MIFFCFTLIRVNCVVEFPSKQKLCYKKGEQIGWKRNYKNGNKNKLQRDLSILLLMLKYTIESEDSAEYLW